MNVKIVLRAIHGEIINLGSGQFKLTINFAWRIFANYIADMKTSVWKDNATRRLYGAKHMENRGIDRGEIASARVQCGNRSPLRFSFSLSVWLNVSLSPFSAFFSVVLSRISFLTLSLSLFHYIQLIAQIFACSSFSICSCFLSRFVYFVFFLCKIQPPILTPRITIFPFREIHEILRLALIWRSGSVSIKNTSPHKTFLCVKSLLFRFFTLISNSDKTRWEL